MARYIKRKAASSHMGRSSVGASRREEELLAILEAFRAANNARDVEAVLAFFTEEIIMRMGPAPFTEVHRSKVQVRSFFLEMLPGLRVERTWNHRVAGNTLTFQARYSSDAIRKDLGVDALESTVEAAFEGDKIKSWNATFTPESIEKLWQALE